MSRKPALLKPEPSRGSKETRAFDRVEPRIADIDRVFHRGLQPVRGGFQTNPARIHSSIMESSVRRASSQRRLRVRGGAWESHPGSLGVFSGFGSLSFSSRETVRANSHETSPKMPHALATGNISKRLRRRESKTSAVLDGAVRFLLTVSAFLYPSSRTRQRARRALPRARRTPHAGTLAHASTNTPAGRFVDPDRVRRQRARSDATEARHLHLRIEPNVSRARVKHHQ